MALLLVDVELDLLVEVPIAGDLTSTFALQWERLRDDAARDLFARRVATKVAPVLAECLDWDLKPPSAAQITFATSIARQMGVDLPGDVLRQRGAMNAFLDEHGEEFKRQLAARRSQKS